MPYQSRKSSFSRHLARPLALMALTSLGVAPLPSAAMAGIQTDTTDLGSTLSNTNFLQSDATALQDQLDAINADLASKQEERAGVARSSEAYQTLTREIAQLQATANGLQTIINKLNDGLTITRYDIVNNSDGSSVIKVTYSDGSTTTANIPSIAEPDDDDSEEEDSGEDDGDDSSSGGSSENPLSSILQSMMPQLLGSIMGNGGLPGMPGTPTGLPTTPSQPQTPEEPAPVAAQESCRPRATTDTAPGKAADDDINANGSTAGGSTGTDTASGAAVTGDELAIRRANEAKAAAANATTGDSLAAQREAEKKKAEQEALEKLPFCEPPQVNTPNPTSTNGSTISSLADAQKYVGRYLCDPSKADCTSNGQQCASLTKALSDLGRTPTWYKGELVMGNPNIAVGTTVATFCNGNNYGSGTYGCSHTGIYLGQSAAGMKILHQYNGSGGAYISTIPWNSWNGNTKEAGNKYYTIVSGRSAFLGIPWYLPSVLAGYDIPLNGEGLAISFRLPYTHSNPNNS